MKYVKASNGKTTHRTKVSHGSGEFRTRCGKSGKVGDGYAEAAGPVTCKQCAKG